ncbi:hypothetical protein [Variovorax sp. RA8]|uniref:hypothetical protein n=1 Tax=Variovorax sp. (strain JCM 16519 / RA8) TaxID=662548 RepID=UPI0018D81B9B|nr:hypothetical protein [Variovorax sp. RA8]
MHAELGGILHRLQGLATRGGQAPAAIRQAGSSVKAARKAPSEARTHNCRPKGLTVAPGVSVNLMPSKSARALPAAATGAHAIGTSALGSTLIGAAALGALAIGALSIGRLFVGRARIRRLDIDELVVRRIRVIEQLTPPPTSKPGVVSQTVGVSAEVAYAFASRMDNLPLWASGLAKGIDQRDGKWFADSPMGEVEVVMAPANPFGVLDHDVTLPDGFSVRNAFRVTPCGEGCLLTFVVPRQAGVSQENFDADVAHVRRDLAKLKDLLEQRAS